VKPNGTVFVVDDDPAVRDSTSMLFEALGLDVRTFANAEAFLETFDPERDHGCLVLDLRLGGMDGLALQQRLSERSCNLPVVFITAYGDVPAALQALRGGAVDFLMKPVREHALLEAVNRALRREQEQRGPCHARHNLQALLHELSARESEILGHVVAGRPTRIIGQLLGISDRTVEAHRAHALTKLQVRSVPELIRKLQQL
jgi:two-component system, LuxR family, response regulator FixJ